MVRSIAVRTLMLTSFLAPPPLATFFASAKTPTEKFQARAKAGFGIALTYCLFFCPGATLAQNYIPATTALVNLNRGKVCAIGSSMSGTFKNNNNSINVGPYYLTKNNQQLGVWQPVTSSTQSVSALEVGSDVTAIQTSPGDQPYINSAVIRFFIIDNPNSKNCSDITFTFANTTTGALNVSYYPYPHALFEMSAYPQGSASVLTVDISNVDSFEAPLMMKVSNGSTAFAEIGNPVYSARAARTTMITGPHDVGGPNSPFVVWLHGQPGYANGPNFFANLALSSAPTSPERYPYALLQSPNGYLSARCTPFNNGFVPPSCNLSNSLLHRSDPLNSFFDNQLTNFFSNAYANPSAPLVVMGDASGIITQQPWTATSNTANCPIYINPDGKSLAMTTQAGTIVICNPVGQVVTLAGQPIGYNQQSALVEISQQQYLAYMKYKGWMFGQPETGFTGTVSQFVAQGGKYYIALIGTNGAPNLSYPVWVFSNINVKAYSGLNWYETASQMVFANDGAFNPWIAAYISNSDLSVVAQSIGRNIVAAFSRGIANCNNVTMASSQPPGFSSNVTKSSTIIPMAANASDAYWSNEANWYPVNGVQDYYVQYIHAARLDNQGNIVPGPTCPHERLLQYIYLPSPTVPFRMGLPIATKAFRWAWAMALDTMKTRST